MIHVLLVVFLITLLYIGIANRLFTYINILIVQGVVLFGVAYVQLHDMNWTNLAFVLLETLIFKAIIIPLFLKGIIRKNKITREAEPFVPNFVSLIIITMLLVGSFLGASTIDMGHLDVVFFVVAISTVFVGLFIIISRKKLVTLVMGYLVIENGIFILSLAVGNEMPMMVNSGILLDIFVSILVLGIFVNKIGDVFKESDVEQLNQLRD
jgi:hydrogenase-4 component E